MKLNFLHKGRILLCFATLFLFVGHVNAQYCTPAFFQGCTLGGAIGDFTLNGESGTSITDIGTGCSGTILGGYYDGTSLPAVTMNAGSTYTITVTSTPCLVGANNFQVWIDFNTNSTFDVGEEVGGGVVSSSTDIPITIPSTATAGTFRLRAMIDVGTVTYPGLNPCPAGPPNTNGETHDYMATIVAGPTCTAPTVTLGAVTCSTKVISWAAVTGATGGYEWTVNTTATSPTAAGTAVPSSTLSVTASSLASGTAYYAHVRTNCGTGFSSWVNLPFTTSGPGPITGNAALCPSSNTQYSNAVAGGTWSSSNTSAATINPSTGVLYGVAPGTTIVGYNVGGCSATLTVNVGTMPAITGNTSVCPSGTTQLSNAVPGGTWSSSVPATASVNGTGLVTAGSGSGTTVITYSASGCSATVTVTVSALPAISGGNTVCVGLTLPLSNTTSGGVWSSSASSIASVASTGVVTGVAVGNATITYTLGGCYVIKAVTVAGAIPAITGTTKFCVNSSTPLSCATTGGTWSSSNTAVATVSGDVTVHGVTAGTSTISYSKGGCASTALVTVDPNNGGTISGPDSVCKGAGHTITLTASQSGGTWSSSNTKATVDATTGVVTGVTSSSSFTITYTVTNTCGTFTVTKAMYVRSASKCSTGLDPVADDMNILSVFPNPNRGIFTVNLSSDLNEDVHIQVSNLLGQTVSNFTAKTNNKTDIKLDVAPGVYLLTASTDHGRFVARVVVEK